jgi:hypothetical protein
MRITKGESTIQELQEPRETISAFGLPLPRFLPRRYKPRNVGEWSGHVAFASDLIVATQPEMIVELGTHWGEAYFTFCQTVEEHGLSCLCYAVDHWLGDEHAGRYGEEVFDEVQRYNERYYRNFSNLIRASFDDAVSQFDDGSIDLLHVDGLHTYGAVSRDFQTWLPKVKSGGIVMLHDICVRKLDFGVWRLWEEIKAEFPSTFEFHHSWGLGVVRKEGETRSSPLTELLFGSSPSVREEVRRHYVVYASHLEHLLGRLPRVAAPVTGVQTPPEIRVQVFPLGATGHSEETSLIHKMTAGAWNTLTFELPEGNGPGPIRVDPGHQPCLVEVGDILIHSHLSGDLLWGDHASSGTRSFVAAGSARVPPGGNGSFVTNSGNDPQLILATPPDMQGPLNLTISLRVSLAPNPAPEIVHSLVSAAQLEQKAIANQLGRTTTDLSRATGELGRVTTELGQVTAAHNRTQERLQVAGDRLRGMQDSLSWKVTGPIRRFMTALRSGPRKTR